MRNPSARAALLTLAAIAASPAAATINPNAPIIDGNVEIAGPNTIFKFDLFSLDATEPVTSLLADVFTVDEFDAVTVQFSLLIPNAAVDADGDGIFGDLVQTDISGAAQNVEFDADRVVGFHAATNAAISVVKDGSAVSAGVRIRAGTPSGDSTESIISTTNGVPNEAIDTAWAIENDPLETLSLDCFFPSYRLVFEFSRPLFINDDNASNQTSGVTAADFEVSDTPDFTDPEPLTGFTSANLSGNPRDRLIVHLAIGTNALPGRYIRIVGPNVTDFLGNPASDDPTAFQICEDCLDPLDTPFAVTASAPVLPADNEVAGTSSIICISSEGLDATEPVWPSVVVFVTTSSNHSTAIFFESIPSSATDGDANGTFGDFPVTDNQGRFNNARINLALVPELESAMNAASALVDQGEAVLASIQIIASTPSVAVSASRVDTTSGVPNEPIDTAFTIDVDPLELLNASISQDSTTISVTLSRSINTGDPANDINQTILSNISGADFEISPTPDFAIPSPLLGASNPRFEGPSNETLTLDLNPMTTNVTDGVYIRIVGPNLRDFLRNPASETDPIQITIACPTDFTGDGVTNAADLADLLALWGPAGAGTPADLDNSGSVTAADLADLLAEWGPCP
ncbi:MAG: hypothetical protein VYC34_03210 [Planctomycetota bacterium]|nr:hypothetical protein [Planctomycetota bacterium]